MRYRIGEFTLCARSLSLSKAGQQVSIRPKTCALLLQLVSKPQVLQSKSELLTAVWDDVQVEEQGLFQSVAEIRKIFAGKEAIKTVPRKGYIWLLPVSESSAPESRRRWPQAWPAVLLVLLALLVPWLWPLATPETDDSESPVLILPFEVHATGADHRWVSYGGMDQLGQMLTARLPMDQSLALLSRNGLTEPPFEDDAVARLFASARLSAVVATSLFGSVGDYQLSYRLYRPDSVERDILRGDAVPALLHQLADVLAARLHTEASHPRTDHKQELANALLAQGLVPFQRQEYDAAIALFEAALQLAPRHPLILQLWAQARLALGEAELVSSTLADWLTQPVPVENLPALYLLRAQSQVQMQLPFDASLQRLRQHADPDRHGLYLAYASELEAQQALENENWQGAEQGFRQALAYHQRIACPYGQAESWRQLARLSRLTGDADSAQEAEQNAQRLLQF